MFAVSYDNYAGRVLPEPASIKGVTHSSGEGHS